MRADRRHGAVARVDLVSTSRFEGVPISILEARRYGLPMVLTDIPGHRDAAPENAAFVAVDDVEAFTAAALGCLERSPGRSVDQARIDEEWASYSAQLTSIVDGAHRAGRSVASTAGTRVPAATRQGI
ncbi:glycosyltransferase [Dactylosporangium sp. NPDC051485]|uniref:glycosyltransferase n=1 Tax=Dactylosporangium sp. NPDC051485 TaxID=3154846 RepID=UPI0034350940